MSIQNRITALGKLLQDGRPRSVLELSCINRQIDDLKNGHKRGLIWDEFEAQRAVKFFSLLKHWKGEWANKPMSLEPWQEHCVIAPMFGWYLGNDRKNGGFRRFRTVYIEVPRKNGKSSLSAGIGLQGLVADHEPGAEVYAAATARDQALIVFKDAKNILGDIREFVNPMAQAIECKELGSTFKPLSSDYNSLDGLNVHRAIIDELHAHKTRDLWDVIMTAQGARRHPMTVAITTAGVDRQSICWELREYSRAVLEGQPEHDDSFFAFIACADENDDWQDENTWRKANPNYGVSVKPEYLKNLAKQARASGSAENNFRRKHLNQWVASEARWIDAGAWVACKDDDFPTLENAECFGAVDLGWRDDLAAFAKVFPDREKIEADDSEEQSDHGPLYKINNAWVKVKFWMPADGKRDITKAPWTNWIQQGLITVTDGNTTDIDEIYHEVVNASKVYNLRRVCLDPNNARQFGQELMKAGIPVKEFWQNRKNYTEPMLDFETAISEGRLHHDGNDLLRWQIGNVQVEVDSQGYCMPSKGKSKDKIDGPVSLLMAWAESMYADLETEWVYEKRGILFL